MLARIHLGTYGFHMDTPEQASRAVSHVVRQALRDAGISQRVAATETGIPLTTLVRRLSGRSPLSVTELAALASLAGVTVSEVAARAERGAAA